MIRYTIQHCTSAGTRRPHSLNLHFVCCALPRYLSISDLFDAFFNLLVTAKQWAGNLSDRIYDLRARYARQRAARSSCTNASVYTSTRTDAGVISGAVFSIKPQAFSCTAPCNTQSFTRTITTAAIPSFTPPMALKTIRPAHLTERQ